MRMFQEEHYPDRYPAFDGRKNLYSSGELPFGREVCIIIYNIRDAKLIQDVEFE